MAKDPAFLFYPGDWLGGTMYLTRAQKGAYFDLLMAQFNSGPLSLEKIKVVLGPDWSLWPAIQDKFIKNEDGLYFNERLAAEKLNRQNYVKGRGENRKSGSKKVKITHDKTYVESYDKSYEKHMENEIINENEVFEIENTKKNVKKSEIEILSKYHGEMIQVLDEFNNIFKSKYSNTTAIQNNYEFWRKKYEFNEIIQAINQIPKNKFWCDKMTPTTLFRRRNPNGEDVDYISTLLNVRERSKQEMQNTEVVGSALNYLAKLQDQ